MFCVYHRAPVLRAQGSLDLKYLADRYERGLLEVKKLFAIHQRFVYVESLNEATGDVVSMQAKMNNSSCRGGFRGHRFNIKDDPLDPRCNHLASPCLVNLYISSCVCHLGPSSIDETITLASSVTAGNDRSILLVLEPQHHGSMEKTSIVKHRRLLEDKIMACLVWVFLFMCGD